MIFFEEVRDSLVSEASQSPNLLSDLAGLENFISESYNNRSFIELLQNADDAKATKFKIIKKGDFLYVANNGRIFNKTDLESLCRSAASSKVRGTAIGYRGIGFKSVVGFAKKIHLISGNLKLTFSKELTKRDIPKAKNVPLIRIPHQLNEYDAIEINPIVDDLLAEGFETIFVFRETIANAIEAEFAAFNYLSMLFLHNIIKAEILIDKPTKIFKNKEEISDGRLTVEIQNNLEKTNWTLIKENENVLAFNISNSLINKLNENDAVVHAFLPTEDLSGLGIIINGDFNTDPSRRHIIFDEHTNSSIQKIGKLILSEFEKALKNFNEENKLIVSALTPYSDPRVSFFKKRSFSNLLQNSLKNNSDRYFKTLKLCPKWLNANDYYEISKELNIPTIHKSFYEVDGLIEFLKYLGASEASFEDFAFCISKITLTNKGCCEVLAFLIKNSITAGIDKKLIMNLPIFVSKDQQFRLCELEKNNLCIDETFLNSLYETGLTQADFKSFMNKIVVHQTTNKMLCISEEEKKPVSFNHEAHSEDDIVNWLDNSYEQANNKLDLKRWRSGEQQVLEILNQKGFELEDVSRQNIGYDLEGKSPEGKHIFIEVKSIDRPGQRFRLTNNEVAVAQEKKDLYLLSLVRQTNSYVEIALIANPIENLPLTRQCVQWIWECTEYEYKPMRFEI